MLPLLLEVLEAAGLPLLMLSVVLGGCCDDTRPKKDQRKQGKPKSKKGHSKKAHGSKSGSRKKGSKRHRSSKGSKSRKKRGTTSTTESGSGSKSKKHGSGSKSHSKRRGRSSGSHTGSRHGVSSNRSRTASASTSRSARGHFSRKASRSKSMDSESKRDQYQQVVDSRRISRPIGGEKPKEIVTEPASLHWSATGGMQKVCLKNPSGERKAIKVKCSDNNLYRVNPVFSFIEPGQSLSIDIVRQNGGAKIDKMVFVIAPAQPEDAKPSELFTPGVANPMVVLPLIAA